MKEEQLVQLATLANDTTINLEKIWLEIGLNQEEEEQKLMEEACSFFEKKQQHFQQMILEYQQKILNMQEEIQHTRQILHQDMSSHQFYDTGAKTLVEKMASLQVECDCLFKIRDERIEKLTELQQELVRICTKLGEPLEAEYLDVTNDLALERMDFFQAQISVKRQEMFKRSQAIEQVSKECCDLIQLLQLEESELDEIDHHFFQQFGTNLIFSFENIEKISLRVQNLQILQKQRQENVDNKKKEIENLYEKLHIPLQEQELFLQKIYPGLGQDVLDLYEMEFKRLMDIKKERLGELIQEIKEKMQDKLTQISQYTSIVQDTMTTTTSSSSCTGEISEEELTILEEKFDILEKKWQKLEFVVKYISMRENILQERQEYEESLKDSSRLMSRSREVGRLLRAEEKIQARIKKDLPKVTSLLEEKLNAWENEFSMGFYYQGQRYLDTMDKQEKEYKLQKEQQKLQNKLAKNGKLQKCTSEKNIIQKKKSNYNNNQSTSSTGSSKSKTDASSNPLENFCSFSRDFSSAGSIKSISTASKTSSDDYNNQVLH